MPIPARPPSIHATLPPGIFREYDIRGIADTELSDAGIRTLGQAIGTYLIRRFSRKVNLARDCRLSSDRLHDALLAGLLAAGCEVTDLGIVPTPLLYYSVFHLKADGGVMITGQPQSARLQRLQGDAWQEHHPRRGDSAGQRTCATAAISKAVRARSQLSISRRLM